MALLTGNTRIALQGLRFAQWPADGPMYPRLRLKVSLWVGQFSWAAAARRPPTPLRAAASDLAASARLAGTGPPEVAVAKWPPAIPRLSCAQIFKLDPMVPVQVKPNLISMKGGMLPHPVTDPSARATPLPPKEWRDMIAGAKVCMRDMCV